MANGIVRLAGGALKGMWRAVDFSRRIILNLLFLLVIIIVALFVFQTPTKMPERAALVIRPIGALVEQAVFDQPLNMMSLGADTFEQNVLSDYLKAIDNARGDERITGLIIETDGLTGTDLSKLAELRTAIMAFKESGKPVLARGRRFTQGQYYLATAADEVELAPDGFLLFQGLARYVTYFKGALDALGIKMHVFRVGEYKSFAEPFVRHDMSKEDRLASKDLLDGLWHVMREDVAAARKLDADRLDRYVDDYSDLLKESRGDTAKVALEAGLVDRLSTEDEWRAWQIERFGGDEEALPRIEVKEYLAIVEKQFYSVEKKIVVLVAQGNIIDGESKNAIGGDSFAKQIRDARKDDAVKALVIRIDSPGGSAWASELIRRELELTRQSGKPVIASMSSIAASGGYWIAAGADEIWAAPTTITGSIGIFGLFPEFSEPLHRLGLTVDGVATSPMAGAFDLRRPLDPVVAEAMQTAIEHGYDRFLETVSSARNIPIDEVDKLARGRVWTGATAEKLGLVDYLGGMDDAIKAAATRAGLDQYQVIWPARQQPLFEFFLYRLLSMAGIEVKNQSMVPANSLLGKALVHLQEEADVWLAWNDPNNLYAHCFCTGVKP